MSSNVATHIGYQEQITAHNEENIWVVSVTSVWGKALEDWHRISRSTKLSDKALLFKDMLRRDIYKYKASFKN